MIKLVQGFEQILSTPSQKGEKSHPAYFRTLTELMGSKHWTVTAG